MNGDAASAGSIDPIPKFPHTRAQLSLIGRQHKPLEIQETDLDPDESSRVPTTLVVKVASLLDEEKEDELKDLLKEVYNITDGESVGLIS